MAGSLKDLIREFVREPKAAETAVAPEERAPEPEIDGASALAIVTLIDAIDDVADLLDEETTAVTDGILGGVEDFTRRKHAMIDRLRRITDELKDERVVLNDDMRAMTLSRVSRLERAMERNAGGLAAVRSAFVSINRALLTSLERAVGEGLYGRFGGGVRPVELSLNNLNREI